MSEQRTIELTINMNDIDSITSVALNSFHIVDRKF
jgi:hypothetical protein